MGLSDTFTDTAGTLLTAHTSDSSHTWAKCTGYTDNMQIAASGGRVRASTVATFPLHYSSWTPSADQWASIDIYQPYEGSVGQVGLYLRADNTAIGTTSYGLAIYSTGVPSLNLKRKIDLYRGGTLLASWTDTVNMSTYLPTTITVYFEAKTNGSQVDLVVKHQGTTVISYSDTSGSRVTSAGKVAFYTYSSGAPAETTDAPIAALTADVFATPALISGSSTATATGSLSLSTPAPATITPAASNAAATGTLALTAPPSIPFGTSAATATGSLDLTTTSATGSRAALGWLGWFVTDTGGSTIPLIAGGATAVATGSLSLTVPSTALISGSSTATARGTLGLTTGSANATITHDTYTVAGTGGLTSTSTANQATVALISDTSPIPA